MTEAQGIPAGLAVDGANRHDMKLVRAQGNRILIWSEKQAANFTPDRFEITDFDRV